jgi:aminopeptidase N
VGNDSDPNNGGSDGKGVRFFADDHGTRKRPQLWSMGMPEGNRYWFPANDSPDDHHTTDFSATVAAP